MARYITDMIEEKLKESGLDFVFYDTNDHIPNNLSDLPRDGKITAITSYTVKNRVEQIGVHNVTYDVTVDFFVPSELAPQFQEAMDLFKDLETPITTLDYSIKMSFPVSARYTSQAVKGQYWQSFTVSGTIIEFNDLSFGDDIELYYVLSQSECVAPLSDPAEFPYQTVTAEDGSRWTGVETEIGSGLWYWQFANVGVGELIDIESWQDGRSMTTTTKNIANTSGDIEKKTIGYSSANTTLSFNKMFNTMKVFDNLILESRHSRKKVKQFNFKFRYKSSVFGKLSFTEYIEPYYLVSVTRTRTKREINQISVSFELGEVL